MRTDLGKICREALKSHNLTPADVFDRMTPHQIAAIFFRGGDDKRFDRDDALAESNALRAKQGLPPVVPFWLFPTVPKVKR